MEKNNSKHEKKVEVKEDSKDNEMGIMRTDRGDEYTYDEWTTPVFDSGPTRQEVEEWKDKYGNIYFTPFEGENFIWRTLSRPEYREAISNQELTLLDREEIFTDKCVLFPRNYQTSKITKGKAGIPSTLTEMIMEKSGFVAQTSPIKL